MRVALVFIAIVIALGTAFFLWPRPDAAQNAATPVPPAAVAVTSPSSAAENSASAVPAVPEPSAPIAADTRAAAAAVSGTSPLGSTTATEAAPRFQTGNLAQGRAASVDSELLAVRGMLRDYRAAFGQNPVGTNREITRALLGNNPRGVRFNFSADASGSAPRLDDRGRLLDRWDHPYFFHQLSGTTLEVRSAGPDGVMWNADDEVSR